MNTHVPTSIKIAIAIVLSIFHIAGDGQWCLAQSNSTSTGDTKPIRVIFLGDSGHHKPSDLYRTIKDPLAKANIVIDYSQNIAETLSSETLDKYDALLVYANIDEIGKDQEKALLDYVAEGRALIALHCATFCFRNSNKYVELVGGQFKEHGGERFATEIVEPEHPIMKGFGGFESWDETYVHHKHNPVDRIVLEERRAGKLAPNTIAEPWTWIRTHGNGRVFYTAWGHNMETWAQPGFQNLLRRGIHWACKRDLDSIPAFSDQKKFPTPEVTAARQDVAGFYLLRSRRQNPKLHSRGSMGYASQTDLANARSTRRR